MVGLIVSLPDPIHGQVVRSGRSGTGSGEVSFTSRRFNAVHAYLCLGSARWGVDSARNRDRSR
jgi:hypothetical protein